MYRTIDAAFWTDPKVRSLSFRLKGVFLYLITNHHTHVSGIYVLPISYAANDMSLSKDALLKDIDTLSASGFVQFDASTEVLWVRNMFRFQGRGEKNLRSAARHLTDDLHGSLLCQDFLVAYPEVTKFLTTPLRLRRQSVPNALRFQVLERDNHRCVVCGATAAEASLEVDHRTPVSRGGNNDLTNLQTLCQPCNLGKGNTLSENRVSEVGNFGTPEQEQDQDSRSLNPESRILKPEICADARIPCGEFQSVLLTPEEIEKLKNRLNGQFEALLHRLDRYSQTNPRKFKNYKSHYAVILSWADKDEQEKQNGKPKSKAELNAEAGRRALAKVNSENGG